MVDDPLTDWKSVLEMPIGPLMAALLRLDERLGGLEDVELRLSPRVRRIPEMTPDDVRPFATSGFSSEHFAFVVDPGADPDASTDERPICLVEKGDVHVIAPHLAGFLSVVAVAGAFAIRRGCDDEHYFALRAERAGRPTQPDLPIGTIFERAVDALAGGDEFLRASAALCTLPGVALAERPSEIVRAHPDRAFRVHVEEPLQLSLPALHALLAKGDLPRAKRTLEGLLARWLDLGDLVSAANWAALKDPIARLGPGVSAEQRAELRKRAAWPD